MIHYPVLLNEALELLQIIPDGVYIDGTFGRGGHTKAILERLGSSGRVIAFDLDIEAVDYAKEHMQDPRLLLLHDNFANLQQHLQQRGINAVDGVLLDLGVSSPQLDTASRGFSFNQDAALDMRLDNTRGVTVSEWINSVDEATLADVLWRYGEERCARKIARNVVLRRVEQPILMTLDLANIIKLSMPNIKMDKHPATRSFQALRIFINDELGSLEKGLEQIPPILKPGARAVVISFHSLEDRIVKTKFNLLAQGERFPKWVTAEAPKPQYTVIAKKVRAGNSELNSNVRSRSAVLRCLEKL